MILMLMLNGTLTILVGDATGHGMMSGMMVSIMKSFFISNRNNIELKQFFENANNSIKDMHLGRLMMATNGCSNYIPKINRYKCRNAIFTLF